MDSNILEIFLPVPVPFPVEWMEVALTFVWPLNNVPLETTDAGAVTSRLKYSLRFQKKGRGETITLLQLGRGH